MKLLKNAVLDNMLTTRFRTWRPVLLVTLYNVMLLGVIVFTMGFSRLVNNTDPNSSGETLYNTLVGFQFCLILLIMPALTSGAISGEKEKKTLDLLLCTQMKPLSIVLGKLFSNCLFMALCVFCSAPMITMAYLYGGISALGILKIFACYMVTIFAVGAIGLFFSTAFKRTTTAVVVSYLTVFMVGVATAVGGYIDLVIQASQNINGVQPQLVFPIIWLFNPAMALLEIMGSGSSSLMGTLMTLGGRGIWPPMWGWQMLTISTIAVLFVALSARLLAPRKGWRAWKKKTVVTNS